MTAEQVAAFRDVVRLHRLVRKMAGTFGCPTWQFMRAIRRVQHAFGLFVGDDHRQHGNDFPVWERLHAAIGRVANRRPLPADGDGEGE